MKTLFDMLFLLNRRLGTGLFLFVTFICRVKAEDWCFITLADWHGAEGYVKYDNVAERDEQIATLKYIKKNYGGELVMLPGDSNSGKWWKKEYPIFFKTSPEDAVIKAGEKCYETMVSVFKEGGYSKLLMAVGDHEIGGNSWGPGELKTELVPQFRDIFQRIFNRNPLTGSLLYSDPIGSADSRPEGTIFYETSYAYRHKNVLFITVDAFKFVEPEGSSLYDKTRGVGGEGAITCSVEGDHLEWFERVLIAAREDSTIKHIIVQAHLPILQPVRKINCSGQFMDYADRSDFWKVMRKYNVDLYFAGEVHATTATKDTQSNLVQIVSRGNGFNNFLKVCVSDDLIDIVSYNEVGQKKKYNAQYEYYGHLSLTKFGEEKRISSNGSLKLFNRWKAVIHLNFEHKFSLAKRPVLGLRHDDETTTLTQSKITIQGVECAESFANRGTYDQQYDAQVGKVMVTYEGANGRGAKFNSMSKVAIWGIGPHSGGHAVSYALYFRTREKDKEMVLVHFGNIFGKYSHQKKDMFTLVLDNGSPALYTKTDQKLVPYDEINLADYAWHHIAVSMPRNSCLLSEVNMFINGKKIQTKVLGQKDSNLFFYTSGRISLGGLGHSAPSYYNQFSHLQPYEGLMDEFYVWARKIYPGDLSNAMRRTKHFDITFRKECGGMEPFKTFSTPADWRCHKSCLDLDSCLGYDYRINDGGSNECRLFDDRPSVGRWRKGMRCAIANYW